MAKKASMKQMSSEELFEMAMERQKQEDDMRKEAAKAEIEVLKAERKQILARHRKELAEIDARIAEKGGAKRGRRGAGSGRSTNVAEAVLGIVASYEQITTGDIKAELATRGIVANNLSQTLAYLKRQGKISSPSRSVYVPA